MLQCDAEWGMSHASATMPHLCDTTHGPHAWLSATSPIDTWYWCALARGPFCAALLRNNTWHDSFMCVTWLIYVCDMTHSCVLRTSASRGPYSAALLRNNVNHGSFYAALLRTCVTRGLFCATCGAFSYRVTWLFYVCDMTHLCVWHDSFMCVTWSRVTWLFHVCDMTHSCMLHVS